MTMPNNDFATRLESLIEGATKGPWIADDGEGFSAWSIWERMAPSGSGTPGKKIAQVIGDSAETDANAELIAYLANHAPAIAVLVRAAQEVSERDHEGISIIRHDIDALRDALAALNAEDKP